VSLELTKTSMPITQVCGTTASRMETHTFLIVTTVPRSVFTPNTTLEVAADMSQMPLPSPDATEPKGHLLVPPFPTPKPRTTILEDQHSPMKHLQSLPKASTSHREPSSNDLTPTGEIAELDISSASDSGPFNKPSRPIYFSRDGTVSGRGQLRGGTDERGKSLDVYELLQTTNWSATPLGPMNQWPQSLKTIGELGHAV
jgi:hypothetical protein